MLYPLLAFNVLVLAAFVFELHQARQERKSLALLIKSGNVSEFVRAERQLASPVTLEDEEAIPTSVDLEDADPEDVLGAIKGDKS